MSRWISDARQYCKKSGINFTIFSVIRLLILSPGFQFVSAYRLVCASRRIPFLGGVVGLVLWTLKCNLFRSEISLEADVSGGLYIPHPYSVVIGRTKIGKNVTILQCVTIGVIGNHDGRSPAINDGAFLGAGACILGGVCVGEGAVVGANSVVLSDVPSGAVAVGAPARVTSTARVEA